MALDEELNREVALKEIQGKHADNLESRSRFLIEAEVTGGLEHPGIVPVYGLGQYPDGRPYYAMRFIRGQSLKEAAALFHKADAANPNRDPGAREIELRQLLNHVLNVCNAMAYAHARGVIHRDLKPANIMLGAFGETLVVDWGLAKTLNETAFPALEEPSMPPLRPLSGSVRSETLYGSTIGTPQFMSPEQAAGLLDEMGPPSDIYSLGATLYAVLTGEPPFRIGGSERFEEPDRLAVVLLGRGVTAEQLVDLGQAHMRPADLEPGDGVVAGFLEEDLIVAQRPVQQQAADRLHLGDLGQVDLADLVQEVVDGVGGEPVNGRGPLLLALDEDRTDPQRDRPGQQQGRGGGHGRLVPFRPAGGAGGPGLSIDRDRLVGQPAHQVVAHVARAGVTIGAIRN